MADIDLQSRHILQRNVQVLPSVQIKGANAAEAGITKFIVSVSIHLRNVEREFLPFRVIATSSCLQSVTRE